MNLEERTQRIGPARLSFTMMVTLSLLFAFMALAGILKLVWTQDIGSPPGLIAVSIPLLISRPTLWLVGWMADGLAQKAH